MFSSRRNPTYGQSRSGGLFGSSSSTPHLRPPKGWKIALIVISLSLLLLIEIVVVVPMLDPSVPGMTLFTYKTGDGREFAVGSCQTGDGAPGVENLP